MFVCEKVTPQSSIVTESFLTYVQAKTNIGKNNTRFKKSTLVLVNKTQVFKKVMLMV